LRLPFRLPGGEPGGRNLKQPGFQQALNHHQAGEVVNLVLRDPAGDLKSYEIRLLRLPRLDQISYFFIPYLTGLVYLISGMYVFGVRRHDPAGRAFASFTTACAIVMVTLFDLNTTHYLAGIWTVSLAIIGAALFNLALLFPESVRLVARYPFMGWSGYVVAAILGVYGWSTIGNFAQPTAYVIAWRLSFAFIGLAIIFFLVMIGLRRFTATSPIVREQARLIFFGALVSFAPLGAWFFFTIPNPSFGFSSLLLLPLGLFPVATGYAIIRYRLISTDYILSRSVVYAILTGLSVAFYVLLVTGFSLISGGLINATNPIPIGIMALIFAVGLLPARRYLQNMVDRYFFRGREIFREKQQSFARELSQAMELTEIINLLRRYVDQSCCGSPAVMSMILWWATLWRCH
jgi:hypothetical protein